MNKPLRCVLVVLFWSMAIVSARTAPDEKTMKEVSLVFLKAAVVDILKNPETAKYFPGVGPENISIAENKALFNASGWRNEWSFQHDVHFVDNPGTQCPFRPVFDSPRGIVFSIFVSSGHGVDMVSRIKNYKIAEKFPLDVGLELRTGDQNAPLPPIDAIIKAHLDAFRQALEQ